MEYEMYKEARDAAWQVLIDQNVTELPVRTSKLCRNMGIEIRRYIPAEGQSDGHTIIVDGVPRILVSKACSPQRARFTAAHELGHILHGDVGRWELVNREPSPDDDQLEQQANVFASRLLAPAIVLRDLGVTSAEEIARICDISKQAAEVRFARLQQLYAQEQQFLRKWGYSCFGLHPLERQVQRQFAEYVRQHRL